MITGSIIKNIMKSIGIILGSIIIIFVISALFPRVLSPIDMIRISLQEIIFRSISNIRYPDAIAQSQGTTTEIWTKLSSILEPGDLIFSHRAGFLTNDLIEGKRKHVSIYIGKKDKNIGLNKNTSDLYRSDTNHNDMLIIDSTEQGVAIRPITSLTYLDDILIIRVNKNGEKIDSMISTIVQHLGKEYNYDFDLYDSSSIFCSQLIYEGLQSIDIQIPYTSFAGRSYLYPQDIVDHIITSGIYNNEFSIISAIKNIQTQPQLYTYDDIITIREIE